MPDAQTSASFRQLFAVREYTAIFLASFLSVLGDQMATIALTVVVYERSGSPLQAHWRTRWCTCRGWLRARCWQRSRTGGPGAA